MVKICFWDKICSIEVGFFESKIFFPRRFFFSAVFFLSATGLLMRTLLLLLRKGKKENLHLCGLTQGNFPSAVLLFFFLKKCMKKKYFFFFSYKMHLEGDVKFVGEESWHPWSWHSVFWCGVSRTK